MDISDILRMIIDFKNRESECEKGNTNEPATLKELTCQLEYYKECEKRRYHFIWLDKIVKGVILDIINDEYKRSKERVRSTSNSLVNLLSDLSKENETTYEDEATRIWQPTMTDNNKVPEDARTQHTRRLEHDYVYAWVLAENKRKGSLNHSVVQSDVFFHKRKRSITSIPEFFAYIAGWLKRKMDTGPLALGIGYDFDNEDEPDWNANLMYKMKETPRTSNHDRHSRLERFFPKNLTASNVQRYNHIRRGVDTLGSQPNRNLGIIPTRWQHYINKKTLF